MQEIVKSDIVNLSILIYLNAKTRTRKQDFATRKGYNNVKG
jgi:hypothetical protein